VNDRDLGLSLCLQISSLTAPFVEETGFSPRHVFGFFIKDQKAGVGLFKGFFSVPLVYVSVFVLVPCWFCHYGSKVQFEIIYCHTYICCWDLLGFHINFMIVFSISMKKDIRLLMGVE
jgi:hypothetical protein